MRKILAILAMVAIAMAGLVVPAPSAHAARYAWLHVYCYSDQDGDGVYDGFPAEGVYLEDASYIYIWDLTTGGDPEQYYFFTKQFGSQYFPLWDGHNYKILLHVIGRPQTCITGPDANPYYFTADYWHTEVVWWGINPFAYPPPP